MSKSPGPTWPPAIPESPLEPGSKPATRASKPEGVPPNNGDSTLRATQHPACHNPSSLTCWASASARRIIGNKARASPAVPLKSCPRLRVPIRKSCWRRRETRRFSPLGTKSRRFMVMGGNILTLAIRGPQVQDATTSPDRTFVSRSRPAARPIRVGKPDKLLTESAGGRDGWADWPNRGH